MLEKPDLPDQFILARLQDEYGLQVSQLTFLPLGADGSAAVYRVVTQDETAYFLKLSQGDFDEITVAVSHFLSAHGLRSIVTPLEIRSQKLWSSLEPFTMVLYPFIEGWNGYEVALTDRQWLDFGTALKCIHTAQVPPQLAQRIPQEIYSPQWREMIKTFQAQAEEIIFGEPTAGKMAAAMQAQRSQIDRLVAWADELGTALQARSMELVLCHADIHAGNLLLGKNDALYIVDWDAPIFAPKEHDLTLVSGCSTWSSARETALFYLGYGRAEIDAMALAYYRHERIVQDIAVECQQIFVGTAGGQKREQEFEYFTSIFLPGHEIELAFQTDEGFE
jgi:spectinomycin phosphotransferase